MPAWAAIECARRGESWKQKQLTREPSSESDADALAPARPEPTTITWYFRLFAGFTSFISKRCLFHFSASGPAGMRASSLMVMAGGSANEAEHDAQREKTESRGDDHREREREATVQRIVRRTRNAQRAERRPCAVIQVQGEKCHRTQIEERNPHRLEPDHHVAVRLAPHERGVQRSGREMQQMIRNEQQQVDAAPPHRARRVRGDLRLAPHVAGRTRRGILHGELVRRDHVKDHRGEQRHAQQPRELDQVHLQEVRVRVETRGTGEELQVAGHMAHDERDEDQPRHAHHDLLADAGVPESPQSTPFHQNLMTAMGSRTASALLASAAFSSAVRVTSMIFSIPLRPSFTGTPRKSPFMPYSPSSHAEHGRMRFWSSTIASTICTAPDDGA